MSGARNPNQIRREVWSRKFSMEGDVLTLRQLVRRHRIYLHEVTEQSMHEMHVGDAVAVTRHCKAVMVTRVC